MCTVGCARGITTVETASTVTTALLTAEDAASMLGVSRAHFYAMHNGGRIPQPIHLGKSVRWRRAELDAWVNAGCPSRVKWDQIKQDSGFH